MSGDTAKLDSLPAPSVSALPRRRRRRLLLATCGVLLALLAWQASHSFVSYTDDAYVRSDVVSVAPEVTATSSPCTSATTRRCGAGTGWPP